VNDEVLDHWGLSRQIQTNKNWQGVARRGSYWMNITGNRKRGEEMLEGEEEIN